MTPTREADCPDTSHRLWVGTAIFGLALAVRIVHLIQIGEAPFFSLLLGDSRGYDLWARAIAAGDWIGGEVFYQAPLYPYFLGVVYLLAGDGEWTVRIIQAAISAFSCVLLAGAAWRLFSRRAGIVAGSLLAFYAPSIFLDALIQKSILDLFFVCLALWLLARVLTDGGGKVVWLALGAALGGLVLTRENALVFVGAVVVWAALSRESVPRKSPLLAALFLAGLALPLLPVAVRNQVVGGEFHLTTSQLGPNFFIGNNPRATGSYVALRAGSGDPALERNDATELAELALQRELSPAEVSRYWTGRALDYIRSQPGDWFRLVARKVLYVCSATELLDTEDQHTYADWSTPLRWTGRVCHFGVIAPLAVAGLWITWGRRRQLWLLHLMLLAYAGGLVAFYIVARYRYPMVPLLILFAAAAVAEAPRFLREVSRPRAGACAAAVLVAALLSNWPIMAEEKARVVTLTNMGAALQGQGRFEEALGYYRRALEVKPDHANAHFNMGIIAHRRGDEDEAARRYERAIEADAGHGRAHMNLAALLLSRAEPERAIEHCRAAVEARPDLSGPHLTWGRALTALGERDEALLHFRVAARLDPDDPRLHVALGDALFRRGETSEAIASYRDALALDPEAMRANVRLGNALELQGDYAGAVDHFTRAWRAGPDSPPLLRRLVSGLRVAGRVEQALGLLREELRRDPDSAAALGELAWILATHPSAEVRDAAAAVGHAERAAVLSSRRDARILDALAAAYANASRFDQAIRTVGAAIELAGAAPGSRPPQLMIERLDLYRRGRPYRESTEELRRRKREWSPAP